MPNNELDDEVDPLTEEDDVVDAADEEDDEVEDDEEEDEDDDVEDDVEDGGDIEPAGNRLCPSRRLRPQRLRDLARRQPRTLGRAA